jgi:tyrosyl-DNA phosphodiesterase-1
MLNSTELIVECQGSSIGTYSPQWLQEMYSTFSGISPEKWLDKTKASRAKLPTPPIRILFPSLQTVKDSVLRFEVGPSFLPIPTRSYNQVLFKSDILY